MQIHFTAKSNFCKFVCLKHLAMVRTQQQETRDLWGTDRLVVVELIATLECVYVQTILGTQSTVWSVQLRVLGFNGKESENVAIIHIWFPRGFSRCAMEIFQWFVASIKPKNIDWSWQMPSFNPANAQGAYCPYIECIARPIHSLHRNIASTEHAAHSCRILSCSIACSRDKMHFYIGALAHTDSHKHTDTSHTCIQTSRVHAYNLAICTRRYSRHVTRRWDRPEWGLAGSLLYRIVEARAEQIQEE